VVLEAAGDPGDTATIPLLFPDLVMDPSLTVSGPDGQPLASGSVLLVQNETPFGGVIGFVPEGVQAQLFAVHVLRPTRVTSIEVYEYDATVNAHVKTRRESGSYDPVAQKIVIVNGDAAEQTVIVTITGKVVRP
jgi:hypothetical protein